MCIMKVPEVEDTEEGTEDLFEKITTEKFLNLVRQKVTQVQESQRFLIQ